MAAVGVFEGIRLSKSVLLFADPVGPGWYLFFMSGLLFFCAVALLARTVRRRKAGLQGRVRLSLQKGLAGRAVLLLLLYGAAIVCLGYVIASAGFFVLVQRLFGERSWVRCAVTGVLMAGSFYLVFSYLANVPLPRGFFMN